MLKKWKFGLIKDKFGRKKTYLVKNGLKKTIGHFEILIVRDMIM